MGAASVELIVSLYCHEKRL